jgi:hypothetical protein
MGEIWNSFYYLSIILRNYKAYLGLHNIKNKELAVIRSIIKVIRVRINIKIIPVNFIFKYLIE